MAIMILLHQIHTYIYVKNEIENSNTKLSDLNDYSSIWTTYYIDNEETGELDWYNVYLFRKDVSQINDDNTYFLTTIKLNDNQFSEVFTYLFNKDSTHLHITYLNLFTPHNSVSETSWIRDCFNEYNVEFADSTRFDEPITLNTDTKVAYLSLSTVTLAP